MADAYRGWAESGAAFHNVSSSPWQLYPALWYFLEAEVFLPGSVHLKTVHLRDRTIFDLFAGSEAHKIPAIEPLLDAYPRRRIVMVGDTGESDPEIYGAFTRRFPDRIVHVLVRAVSPGGDTAERYHAAFDGVPEHRWTAFDDPQALADIRLAPNAPSATAR